MLKQYIFRGIPGGSGGFRVGSGGSGWVLGFTDTPQRTKFSRKIISCSTTILNNKFVTKQLIKTKGYNYIFIKVK